MKKIIRFLAKVSGVEDQIANEVIRDVGNTMYTNHWWWTGGLEYNHKSKYDVMKAFELYSEYLKNGWFSPPIHIIRQEVYRLFPEEEKEKKKS